MLYDELWVPWLKESYPDKKEIEDWGLDQERLAAIAYLESEGLVKESPIDLSKGFLPDDEVTNALMELYETESSKASKTYATPEQAALEGAVASFNIDIALSRLTSYILWKTRQEVVYPVAFPFDERRAIPKHLSQTQVVLSIVLKRLPTPSSDLPLEDIVAFKKDEDTKYKFARFWHWVREISVAPTSRNELEEKIDWLITDYSRHLMQLTKKVKSEQVEVLVTTPLELLEDLVKSRWGKLAKGLFALRRKAISAHDAEMKLPGSELAYVTEASMALSRRYKA